MCFHNSSEKKKVKRLKMANMREPRTMTMKRVAICLPLVILPSPITRLLPPSHSHPSTSSSKKKINFGSAKSHPLVVQAHRGRQRWREVLCPNLRIPGNNSWQLVFFARHFGSRILTPWAVGEFNLWIRDNRFLTRWCNDDVWGSVAVWWLNLFFFLSYFWFGWMHSSRNLNLVWIFLLACVYLNDDISFAWKLTLTPDKDTTFNKVGYNGRLITIFS